MCWITCTRVAAPWLFDDSEVILLDRVASSKPIQTFLPIGCRGCVHSKAVGKAILAHLPTQHVNRILKDRGLEVRTPYTVTDYAALIKQLEIIRRRGFAVVPQEDDMNLNAVGAAIVGFQGEPVAGLAISDLVVNMPRQRMEILGDALRETAALISQQLGYVAGQHEGCSETGHDR